MITEKYVSCEVTNRQQRIPNRHRAKLWTCLVVLGFGSLLLLKPLIIPTGDGSYKAGSAVSWLLQRGHVCSCSGMCFSTIFFFVCLWNDIFSLKIKWQEDCLFPNCCSPSAVCLLSWVHLVTHLAALCQAFSGQGSAIDFRHDAAAAWKAFAQLGKASLSTHKHRPILDIQCAVIWGFLLWRQLQGLLKRGVRILTGKSVHYHPVLFLEAP